MAGLEKSGVGMRYNKLFYNSVDNDERSNTTLTA